MRVTNILSPHRKMKWKFTRFCFLLSNGAIWWTFVVIKHKTHTSKEEDEEEEEGEEEGRRKKQCQTYFRFLISWFSFFHPLTFENCSFLMISRLFPNNNNNINQKQHLIIDDCVESWDQFISSYSFHAHCRQI